jgi:hypothetical protein
MGLCRSLCGVGHVVACVWVCVHYSFSQDEPPPGRAHWQEAVNNGWRRPDCLPSLAVKPMFRVGQKTPLGRPFSDQSGSREGAAKNPRRGDRFCGVRFSCEWARSEPRRDRRGKVGRWEGGGVGRGGRWRRTGRRAALLSSASVRDPLPCSNASASSLHCAIPPRHSGVETCAPLCLCSPVSVFDARSPCETVALVFAHNTTIAPQHPSPQAGSRAFTPAKHSLVRVALTPPDHKR